MKKRKLIPPPKSVHNHGLAKAIRVGNLSDVTREAILDGRAVYFSRGVEYKLIPLL